MNPLGNAVCLPLRFDRELLRTDLAQIEPQDWVPHFNTQYFEGDWSGVALRAADRSNTELYPDPSAQRYVEMPVLERCPYLREIIAGFQCSLRTVRLLKLSAGSSIREHCDQDLEFESGEVRLHVPVATNPDVEFYLDNQRVMMAEGECWYLNLSLPHRVENHSVTDRIHLVIDCTLNDWLRTLIVEKGEVRAAGPEGDFEEFRQLVLADLALQKRLQGFERREDFVNAAAALGRELGCRVSEGKIDAALRAAKRTWRERCI